MEHGFCARADSLPYVYCGSCWLGLFAHAYADDLQVHCHLSPGEEHCNVLGVAQILLVDGCPLIS